MNPLKRRALFFVLTISLTPTLLRAQVSVTVKDAAEISYKSELLIGEFRDLLNIISNTETDLKETKDLIYNSHSGEKNRIFYTPTVLIENDINPQIHSTADAREITIDKYLNDLDLLYHKSDTPSIRFDNIHVSNLKKGEYLYVKVFYNSVFYNKPQKADSGYAVNNRMAEIRVDKDKSKWTMRIVRLGFFLPSDTLNRETDSSDVELAYEPESVPAAAPGDASATAAPASQPASFTEELKARERAKQVEEYKREQDNYNKLLEKGDQALTANDYTASLNAFTEASSLSPYEIYPKSKIRQIRQLIEQVKLNTEELYTQYLEKAHIAEKARKYEEAKEYYTNALAKKPEASGTIEQSIRALTEKIRQLTEPGEKFNAGLFKEAIKDYDRAIKKDNTNSDFFLGRGKCYDELGDFSRALKDYDQAYDLDNNNLPAIKLRAELYARKGDNFKALTDYKIYSTIDKTDTSIFLRMSELHILTGSLPNALEDLDRVLALNPQHANAYYRKGLLQYKQQNIKEAYNNFSSSIKAAPVNPKAYYQRGLCDIAMGNVAAAGDDFGNARKQGVDTLAVININELALEYYRKCTAAFNAQLIDSALVCVNEAITINPYHSEFRYKKGECYYVKNDYVNAISNYSDAIALDKGYYAALYKRGLSKYYQQAYKEAIIDLESGTKVNPMEPITYKVLGDACYMLKQYSAAINWYDNGLQTSKNSKTAYDEAVLADLYNNYGKSAFETGNYARALELFKNATRYGKSFAEAFYNRGNTYLQLNQLGDAHDDIIKALSFQSGNARWNFTLGQVLRQKEDYPSAMLQFGTAIRLDSTGKLPQAYYKRGECLYRMNNYQEALPDYLVSRSNGTDTLSNSFSDELANIYLQLGKSDSSRMCFGEMLKRDSVSAPAWYGTACTYVQQQKTEQALTCFEKAFSTGAIKYSAIKRDPIIAPIKDDKRFKALVKKYL